MQYDCGDILFDFFFRDDYAITWSATSGDICLDVGSAAEARGDLSLAVESHQMAGSDVLLAVESSIAVGSATAFEVKAMSVSAICLGVQHRGWRDSRLVLRVSQENAVGNHQTLLSVREEDWFTN